MQTGITVVKGIPLCRTMNIRTLRGCVQCDAIRSVNVNIFQGKCPSETGIGSRVQHTMLKDVMTQQLPAVEFGIKAHALAWHVRHAYYLSFDMRWFQSMISRGHNSNSLRFCV